MTPRHHGDPAAEYAAATRAPGTPGAALAGAALFDRSEARTRLLVHGRAPARMLLGLVTGRIPADPVPLPGAVPEGGPAWWQGDVAPSLVLTPKGRIVTDLRLLRLGAGEEGHFLLDLPRAGHEPLSAHLARFLPPRLARSRDVSEGVGQHAVVGPGAAEALRRALDTVFSGSASSIRLPETPSHALFLGAPAPEVEAPFLCLRGELALDPPAFEILGTPALLAPLLEALRAGGVRPAGDGVWHTLRVEAGTPETGAELGPDVIPPEAGLQRSHIDHQKGCYTGQEVIVRIRDRGHVNRHLRGLLLGERPAPPRGTPLWIEGRDREAGEILTTAASPRWGQTVALAWVRREAAPGSQVHLGTPDGPVAEVRSLERGAPEAGGLTVPDGGWGDAPGDAVALAPH